MKQFPQDFVDGLTDLELVAMWKELKDNFPVEDAEYIKQLDDECKKRLERRKGWRPGLVAEIEAEMKGSK